MSCYVLITGLCLRVTTAEQSSGIFRYKNLSVNPLMNNFAILSLFYICTFQIYIFQDITIYRLVEVLWSSMLISVRYNFLSSTPFFIKLALHFCFMCFFFSTSVPIPDYCMYCNVIVSQSGQRIAVLAGHSHPITCLLHLPATGTEYHKRPLIVSASSDKQIRVR